MKKFFIILLFCIFGITGKCFAKSELDVVSPTTTGNWVFTNTSSFTNVLAGTITVSGQIVLDDGKTVDGVDISQLAISSGNTQGQLDTLETEVSADTNTISGLLSALDTEVSADTNTIAGLLSALDTEVSADTTTLQGLIDLVELDTGTNKTSITALEVSTGAYADTVNISTGEILAELRTSTGTGISGNVVTDLIAGTGVTFNEATSTGTVTINASGGGGTSVSSSVVCMNISILDNDLYCSSQTLGIQGSSWTLRECRAYIVNQSTLNNIVCELNISYHGTPTTYSSIFTTPVSDLLITPTAYYSAPVTSFAISSIGKDDVLTLYIRQTGTTDNVGVVKPDAGSSTPGGGLSIFLKGDKTWGD